MKKVWIASIFATLMLIVPITNVAGASEVVDDCGCQPVNKVDYVRVKLLLKRVEVFTNVILSKFGHIPDVTEKCQEVSNEIKEIRDIINDLKPDLPWENYPIICTTLFILIVQILLLVEFMGVISQIFPILYNLFEIIANWIGELIMTPLIRLFEKLECIELS